LEAGKKSQDGEKGLQTTALPMIQVGKVPGGAKGWGALRDLGNWTRAGEHRETQLWVEKVKSLEKGRGKKKEGNLDLKRNIKEKKAKKRKNKAKKKKLVSGHKDSPRGVLRREKKQFGKNYRCSSWGKGEWEKNRLRKGRARKGFGAGKKPEEN